MHAVRVALASLNIANPLVAWLVYRGEMVSSAEVHEQALGFWLMRALSAESSTGHRSAVFQDELVLDALREVHQPHAISRLRGFYLFDDEASAERAIQQWGGSFHRHALTEVGILEGSRWSRHDAEWISTRIGSGDRSWMLPYLRGEPSGDDPIWELLVDGRAVIFGTQLREAAYEVVQRVWPQSLALLELSRVAVEFRSDLGVITPMVLGQVNDHRVDFAMNFVDATNQEFLERFSRYDGPKNQNDLGPGSDLVLPDLRPYSFKLPALRKLS
jgi:hypothetical protein